MQSHLSLLNTDMMHNLYMLLEEAPEMYLSEIQDWMALTYKVNISGSTLYENICDAGLSYKLLCRAAGEHDEDYQQEWRQGVNDHYIASQMVFVDETSKDDHTIYWHYECAVTGRRATINANFMRGDQFSMAAALSLDGYKAMHVVLGSVDGEEFLDFIVNDVVHFSFYSFWFSIELPVYQLPSMNPYPQDKSILVLDNCMIQKMGVLWEIIEGFGHVLLFLPPYSPDLNPIEKSFSCGTSYVWAYGFGSTGTNQVLEVKQWIRKNWHNIQATNYPKIMLLESLAVVIAEKARGWFMHSGYNIL